MTDNKFFVTTPIYYVNDVPHIGHVCTTVMADIIARYHRQKKEEVFFLTGTDEHGQKIAEEAEKEKLSPQEFCDKISPRFETAWRSLNISFDYFIRTTDLRHKKIVSEVLAKIYDKGDVYKGKYEGYYCVGCEKFLTEADMVDNKCPLHPPEKTAFRSEDNWFFKLSKYVPRLIELIENDKTNYIYPAGKRKEILTKLKAGVRDVSISRENVKWGIPLPWDEKQITYVWFDALLNYYSATQFLENRKGFWPAGLHLVGKEISWFHTVIWQAMLLSVELALPKKVFIHSFYTIDGQKMSKSLGNVISPEKLVEIFEVDGARYLIASSFPAENDVDVGIDRFKEKYNADLANNLGNLVSRVAKLAEGMVIEQKEITFDKEFEKLFDSYKISELINLIFEKYINISNEKLNQVGPWKLEKSDPKRIDVLKFCINNLKIIAYNLRPIMPEVSEKIGKCLDNQVMPLQNILFNRIK